MILSSKKIALISALAIVILIVVLIVFPGISDRFRHPPCTIAGSRVDR